MMNRWMDGWLAIRQALVGTKETQKVEEKQRQEWGMSGKTYCRRQDLGTLALEEVFHVAGMEEAEVFSQVG